MFINGKWMTEAEIQAYIKELEHKAGFVQKLLIYLNNCIDRYSKNPECDYKNGQMRAYENVRRDVEKMCDSVVCNDCGRLIPHEELYRIDLKLLCCECYHKESMNLED